MEATKRKYEEAHGNLDAENNPLNPDLNLQNEDDDAGEYVPYVPLKQRRDAKLMKLVNHRRAPEPAVQDEPSDDEDAPKAGPKATQSLLDQAAEVRKKQALHGWYNPYLFGSDWNEQNSLE
ncbi:hypothetical protein BC936DRAFT_144044 [Jimgerdemannia flammicorona]|uniref:Uncharacterized protein n=1 Tax=Jimgerdemannia flammicorona TaxID=994334 RepID=A0A433DD29_9FUNG|nr:hypothetical protein BC936DRAFT_144044 [Jimgerdemannia flammicorona]